MGDQRAHARFNASGAYRWFACPGSPREIAKLPAEAIQTSIWAEEGTEAHAELNRILWSGQPAADENIQIAADYINDLRRQPGFHFLEHKFEIFVEAAPGDVWGTSDAVVYDADAQTLHVIDYKHGIGVVVEPRENKQLLFYGLGIFILFAHLPIQKVVLTIIQPRAFHPKGAIRHWEILPSRLLEFYAELVARINDCQQPDAPLVPGAEQCRWCPVGASDACPALRARALSAARADFTSVRDISVKTLPKPEELGIDRIAYILQAKGLLENWLANVEEYAQGLAKQGWHIPGFKLVNAQRKRRYNGDPDQLAQQMVAVTGLPLDMIMPRKLVGITEGEKLFIAAVRQMQPSFKAKDAAQVGRELFAWFTIKDPSPNTTLAPVSDPRPEVSATAAFEGVNLPVIEVKPNG